VKQKLNRIREVRIINTVGYLQECEKMQTKTYLGGFKGGDTLPTKD
jgi:hypothetical protein